MTALLIIEGILLIAVIGVSLLCLWLTIKGYGDDTYEQRWERMKFLAEIKNKKHQP